LLAVARVDKFKRAHDAPCVLVHEHGDVYARDDAVYWGFSRASLDRVGSLAFAGSSCSMRP
jgi:hypothetical protein